MKTLAHLPEDSRETNRLTHAHPRVEIHWNRYADRLAAKTALANPEPS